MDEPGGGSKLNSLLEKIGRRRTNAVVGFGVRCARALVKGYDGPRARLADMAANGEARVLQQLRGELRTVFDVGANIGGWTQHALDAGAKSIHAFEISPSTAATYTQRHGANSQVHINTFGLSNEAGSVTIHHYPDHPALTTMTEYPHDVPSTPLEVPVRTGDSYVAEHGIEHIDFLKLDVEGAEEFVIAGFADTFARNAVSVLQFEYGKVAILTKYLLRDFYADMERHGFLVGRISPERVDFMAYDFTMENFNDSNWLAVHESRRDLIARVS